MRLPALLILISAALTLTACSTSPSIISVHLIGDQTKTDYRFIKVAAIEGDRVLFSQTYSCDRKDCYPTREDIDDLKGIYGKATYLKAPASAVELERQSGHVSTLRWKGTPASPRVTVRAVLYTPQYVPLAQAEQSLRRGFPGLWGTQLTVAERGSGIELALE